MPRGILELPSASRLLGGEAAFEQVVQFLHLTQTFRPFVVGEIAGITECEGIAATDESQATHQHFPLTIAQFESHRLAHGISTQF